MCDCLVQRDWAKGYDCLSIARFKMHRRRARNSSRVQCRRLLCSIESALTQGDLKGYFPEREPMLLSEQGSYYAVYSNGIHNSNEALSGKITLYFFGPTQLYDMIWDYEMIP
jgi:predicted small secreted protein